jgi:oligopeptide/dipeptide ABC transporter ATP-binding protein
MSLQVDNLAVEFQTYGGNIYAVRDVSFSVKPGRTLAIVGESGSGKSVTVQSLMGLIPIPPGRITAGSAKLDGHELLGLNQQELNQFRGKRIGMIFQDPMTSMNPTMKVGVQIAETLQVHLGMTLKEALSEALDLLELVQIPEAERRLSQYPWEYSGGMLQRAGIAMALACRPDYLIADEPTTALDVTIQAQILHLLKQLQSERKLAIILITHDLGVVARMAHDVAVMYAGQIVEQGRIDDVFYRPAHPYTLGLLKAMPDRKEQAFLTPIPGSPPDLFRPPTGCAFAARCPYARKICTETTAPVYSIDLHYSRCWLQHSQAPVVKELTKLSQE